MKKNDNGQENEFLGKDIQKLRKEIDKVDTKLLELYVKRMQIAEAIGAYKQENNLPFYDEQRESEKLASVFDAIDEPKYADGAAQLFLTLMEASRELQEKNAGADDYDTFWEVFDDDDDSDNIDEDGYDELDDEEFEEELADAFDDDEI